MCALCTVWNVCIYLVVFPFSPEINWKFQRTKSDLEQKRRILVQWPHFIHKNVHIDFLSSRELAFWQQHEEKHICDAAYIALFWHACMFLKCLPFVFENRWTLAQILNCTTNVGQIGILNAFSLHLSTFHRNRKIAAARRTQLVDTKNYHLHK